MKAKYTDEAQTIVSYGNASGKAEDLIRLGYMPEDAEIEAYDADGSIAKEKERLAHKATRDQSLAAMTHTLPDGRVLQCRPEDLTLLQTAVSMGSDIEWVLADNTVAMVTVAELEETINSGVAQAQAIWETYKESLK